MLYGNSDMEAIELQAEMYCAMTSINTMFKETVDLLDYLENMGDDVYLYAEADGGEKGISGFFKKMWNKIKDFFIWLLEWVVKIINFFLSLINAVFGTTLKISFGTAGKKDSDTSAPGTTDSKTTDSKTTEIKSYSGEQFHNISTTLKSFKTKTFGVDNPISSLPNVWGFMIDVIRASINGNIVDSAISIIKDSGYDEATIVEIIQGLSGTNIDFLNGTKIDLKMVRKFNTEFETLYYRKMETIIDIVTAISKNNSDLFKQRDVVLELSKQDKLSEIHEGFTFDRFENSKNRNLSRLTSISKNGIKMGKRVLVRNSLLDICEKMLGKVDFETIDEIKKAGINTSNIGIMEPAASYVHLITDMLDGKDVKGYCDTMVTNINSFADSYKFQKLKDIPKGFTTADEKVFLSEANEAFRKAVDGVTFKFEKKGNTYIFNKGDISKSTEIELTTKDFTFLSVLDNKTEGPKRYDKLKTQNDKLQELKKDFTKMQSDYKKSLENTINELSMKKDKKGYIEKTDADYDTVGLKGKITDEAVRKDYVQAIKDSTIAIRSVYNEYVNENMDILQFIGGVEVSLVTNHLLYETMEIAYILYTECFLLSVLTAIQIYINKDEDGAFETEEAKLVRDTFKKNFEKYHTGRMEKYKALLSVFKTK